MASQAVFVGEDTRPLTTRDVTAYLKRLADHAGIDELSQGRLRCTMATLLYRETPSIEAVQEALGLDDIGSAARYVRLSQKQVLKVHCEYSPLAVMLSERS